MGTTLVSCHYPEPDDYDNPGTPPDEWGEWRPESGECRHDHCIEAAQFRREFYAQQRYGVSAQEREEIMADTELFRDEFHGRDPWA